MDVKYVLGSDNEVKTKGFDLFRANMVRRLTPTHVLVKTEAGSGSFLVELQNGNWNCDCDANKKTCEHRFAAQLAAAAIHPIINDSDEQRLICRYCGSPDLARSGFRYNAYGISRRYRCNECSRKFSTQYTDGTKSSRTPSELFWLLSEIGMILTKLENLIEKASLKLAESTEANAS